MQLTAARLAANRPARPLSQPPASSRQTITPYGVVQPAAPGQPGDKLLPLLRSPFDLLALPGRVGLGALQSLPEILEKIPADVERLSLLAQDPRTLEEKQAEVLGELEDRVCGYLQKGSATESEVLGSISAVLPEPVKDAMPEPLKEALLQRNAAAVDTTWASDYSTTAPLNGAPPAPLATWTISTDDDVVVPPQRLDGVEGDEYGNGLPPMTPAAVAASQTAAEVLEVNAAVSALREQLAELAANADPARDNIIKLNMREAEQTLARRLEQMAPSHRAIGDASVQAAVREAEALLAEVQALSA